MDAFQVADAFARRHDLTLGHWYRVVFIDGSRPVEGKWVGNNPGGRLLLFRNDEMTH